MHRISCFGLLLLPLLGCATSGGAVADDEPHAVIGAAAVKPHTPTDWRELRSEHFTLTTDFSEATARHLIERLERLREALLDDVWGGPRLEGDRTHAVIFASRSEFEAATDENLAGFSRPGMIVSFGSKLEEQSIFAHELTHVIARRFLINPPLWFNEGLAKWCETINLDYGGDPNTVELGNINEHLVRYLKIHGRMPMAQVLALNYRQFNIDSSAYDLFEPSAWLLVYYLVNAHSDGFQKYQVALTRGTPPDEAWKAAFPDIKVDDLDETLTRFLKYGRFTVYHPTLPPESHHQVTVRELGEPEVHALMASLILSSPGKRSHDERVSRAKDELAPAIAAAPDDPHVVDVEFAWMKKQEVLPLVRRAVAAHPDSALAWGDLSSALAGDDSAAAERLAALGRAVALDPQDASSLNNWAWELLEQHRPAEALEPALRAAKADPDEATLDTLARALAENHRCKEAIPIEHRAIAAVPSEQRGRVHALVENLARLEADCDAGSTAQH